MIGGPLIHIRACGDRVLLWIAVAGSDVEEMATWVRPAPRLPALGDEVWWQGRHAYWTPSDGACRCERGRGELWDIPLDCLGRSFDPLREMCA